MKMILYRKVNYNYTYANYKGIEWEKVPLCFRLNARDFTIKMTYVRHILINNGKPAMAALANPLSLQNEASRGGERQRLSPRTANRSRCFPCGPVP
ncbi:unnamed protein product [Nesidiocoris tenuis]|uniref:Uncharacterized protein n=1 Tax=Nesidiocoris tenuis TaxID=355587 RepID=A0A6H5GI52_9HEMI|nr:unnamed protein product [Nesidiocoris tenuis]